MIRRDLVASGIGVDGMRWTNMRDDRMDRFGGAWEDCTVNMHEWVDGQIVLRTRKCRSYRQAVRILSYFVRGVNP